VSNRAALVALLRDSAAEQAPVTRYALSGDNHIAYQVLGDGPRDLILIPGFVSNVETAWTWPALARFLRRLAAGPAPHRVRQARHRLVGPGRRPFLPDPGTAHGRGTGGHGRHRGHRGALLGFSEGAALGMLFAASYPARTNGLILYGGLISPSLDTAANAVVNVFADPAAAWEIMRQVWGTGQFMAPFLPTAASTESGMAHIALRAPRRQPGGGLCHHPHGGRHRGPGPVPGRACPKPGHAPA
jgi:pimeloyl-ACP methyl ester carboxylesterase